MNKKEETVVIETKKSIDSKWDTKGTFWWHPPSLFSVRVIAHLSYISASIEVFETTTICCPQWNCHCKVLNVLPMHSSRESSLPNSGDVSRTQDKWTVRELHRMVTLRDDDDNDKEDDADEMMVVVQVNQETAKMTETKELKAQKDGWSVVTHGERAFHCHHKSNSTTLPVVLLSLHFVGYDYEASRVS